MRCIEYSELGINYYNGSCNNSFHDTLRRLNNDKISVLRAKKLLGFPRKHSNKLILVTLANVVATITIWNINKFSYKKINGANLTDNGNHRAKVAIITTLNTGNLSNKHPNCKGNSKIVINLSGSSHNVFYCLILTKINLIRLTLVVPNQNKIPRKSSRASRVVQHDNKERRTERCS